TLAAIDQAFRVEADEDFGDRLRQTWVHGEAVAPPVDGSAEPAHLIGDLAAGLLFPLPNLVDECLAPEFHAADARGTELALHHHLRGDTRVIGARLPQG